MEFLGDAFGDGACGDAARLGVADQARDASAQLQADFGELGGLPRAGFAGEDDHLVVGDGVFDLVAALDDRERIGVGGLGEVALALLAAAQRAVDVGGDLGEGVRDVPTLVDAALDAAEAAAQGVAVSAAWVVWPV